MVCGPEPAVFFSLSSSFFFFFFFYLFFYAGDRIRVFQKAVGGEGLARVRAKYIVSYKRNALRVLA